jgi:hypothetical protein
MARERTDYSIVGGILSAIAAFICLFVGGLFIIGGGVLGIIPGVIGIAAFVFGSWGGILSFRKQNYNRALTFAYLPLFEGMIVILALGSSGVNGRLAGLMVASPIVASSLLSMILITASKAVFSPAKTPLLSHGVYCRYRGAKNKTDAQFCEKYGKSFA